MFETKMPPIKIGRSQISSAFKAFIKVHFWSSLAA